jgi:hypothetical protein
MSTVVEKIYADCAPNQAPEYLERFFSMQTQGSEGKIIVPLRAPMDVAGFTRSLEKSVNVVISAARTGTDMIPRIALRWEPASGGPFPTFQGTLALEADEDYSACALVLRGDYTPPLGIAGKTFDAAFGRRIARATARELLERIREFIEAAYQETEREKRTHAPV